MAVKVTAYKHGSLTLDLYVKITRVWGGKAEGWGSVMQSFATKADADSGSGLLMEFNFSGVDYVDGEHPFVSIYSAYKSKMALDGYSCTDV